MTEEEFQAASQASIAAGGLPLNAISRLKEQASRQGTPSHIFTSDLSPNELLLTHKCGFEPLGQVMGSSVYHVGWYAGPGWQPYSGELGVLTQAYYNARHLAMKRLQEEAQLLGATGVVGVRVEEKNFDSSEGMIEFATVGTAVRETSAPPLAPGAWPFVSALSGQEHYALRQGGYKPVGFAMGNCTWFEYASYQTRMATGGGLLGSGWNNQELTDYTQAVYMARELAMERMQNEAAACGANGIVGVKVGFSYNEWDGGQNSQYRGIILHFNTMGTCIARDYGPEKNIESKATVLLND
jgi:uncharacterized protein YbjQ (UPF0145 family)